MRVRHGTCQVVLPEWSYDLLVFVFFPINWIIATLPSRFPSPYNIKDWPLDATLDPSKLPTPHVGLQELSEIIRRRDNTRLHDEEIWSLFDSLPAPKSNDLIGNWRGKVLFTGSWLDPAAYLLEIPLRLFGCDWGKRFFSAYRGDPLILLLWNKIVVPIPMWGNVSLPEIQLRGKSGAAMTYDHQPWKDHFRILDGGRVSGRRMLLGNWMSREKNGGWFTLEEMPKMDEAMRDLLVTSPY